MSSQFLFFVNFVILLASPAHEAGNLRGYSPNIAADSRRPEAGGAIPRPIKQVTRTTVKREPVGKIFVTFYYKITE